MFPRTTPDVNFTSPEVRSAFTYTNVVLASAVIASPSTVLTNEVLFFQVSNVDTGVSVTNFQFDRYCTLLDGLVKLLKSKNYKLQIINYELRSI